MSSFDRKHDRFYVAIGCIGVFAVVFGFGTTYLLPLRRGTLDVPPVVHIHGALATIWVVMYLAQAWLVRRHRPRWHRRIGTMGLPLAIGILLTMLPVGFFQATRDAQAGAGPTGISSLVGVFTTGALFVGLVAAGIITRQRREAHARWMLLATLVLLWPAWYRFRHYFPTVPRPDIWFAVVLAYIWIPLAALRDHLVRGSVHPVITWGGLGVILEQSFEVLAFDTAWWRAIAHVLYNWLASSWLV